MVDFNKEATVSTAPHNIIKILLLQRRNDFLEAFEDCMKKEYEDVMTSWAIAQARLFTLFLEFQATIKRKEKDYIQIKEDLSNKEMNKEQLLEHFETINILLDELNKTKIDTKRVYDKTSIEEENMMKGL